MKLKNIILGGLIAASCSNAFAQYTIATASGLVKFTADREGILFVTDHEGASPCVEDYGVEYRIPLDHPNYKALASTVLAASMDPDNALLSFKYMWATYQDVGPGECFEVESVSRYTGS